MHMHLSPRSLALCAALILLVLACAVSGPQRVRRHGWWHGFGPVVPHETFPADCKLCHVGRGWQSLREDFEFDHGVETGVPLEGSHQSAQCIRCHNDRGPVDSFAAQGCAGCHEDVHQGDLGQDCSRCHQEGTWRPVGQVALHDRTRFPLIGVHAATACWRCHPGAEVGNFQPTPVDCLGCHVDDLAGAQNPNHVGLGWVDRCHRCHIPTAWQQAEVD